MMKNTMNFMDTVREIISFSPRQLDGEHNTAAYIISFLQKENIQYSLEEFDVDIPRARNSSLTADGVNVPCEGNCFVSGKIEGKDHIISALFSDVHPTEGSIIAINPQCPSISLPAYYPVPAVAVSHKSLCDLLAAQHVQGLVEVERVKHRSTHILVGNMIDPQHICFAHYDSIETGAIDNASGVAILMHVIKEHPTSLQDTLYVFAANEELSYDGEVYWGYGYRVFEKMHENVMAQVRQIVVVDSVGNGAVQKIDDVALLQLGFPIVHMQEWREKITFFSGDFSHLMSVYHSKDDDGRGMTEEYMYETYEVVCDALGLRTHERN